MQERLNFALEQQSFQLLWGLLTTIKIYISKVRKLHTMQGLSWQAGVSTLSQAAVTGRQKTQPKVSTS